MTRFCKTNQIVTVGLFHFIGPVKGHTCTLHIRSAITRLGGPVCFSRTSFPDPVNSSLRQWDPWVALHGRHGSEIHPSDGDTSLMPFKHVWVYGWHFWDPWLAQTVPMEDLTHIWLPTHPPPTYNIPSVILQWF